ncbi:MAG: hypothetical protein IIA59_01465 [Candidatus Marinimicrobia bacterium]|nr:hypothetical protein [Candidatus Neomarinimicrobiota bacterium]
MTKGIEITQKKKNRHAVALGKKGGKKGGKARAENLTSERRKAIAQKAAAMRWGKMPSNKSLADSESGQKSPFAKYQGALSLGGDPIDVYVLDTDERVMSLRSVVKAIAGVEHGDLGGYIGVQVLKPYINSDLILGETKEFHIPGTQLMGKGIKAEGFLEICNAYIRALEDHTLATDRQKEIAIQCSILLGACAKIGLIALIDEATGFQYERQEDALRVKIRAFIADELREWEKTFPDELWEQFGRLTNWRGALHSRPKWWGKLVLELIYDALDPDIAKYLKENKPPPRVGQNYHQWFTQDLGLKALIPHIYEVIGIAKTCENIRELRQKVAELYGREPMQMTLYLPRNISRN